jgi:hypothetical protein
MSAYDLPEATSELTLRQLETLLMLQRDTEHLISVSLERFDSILILTSARAEKCRDYGVRTRFTTPTPPSANAVHAPLVLAKVFSVTWIIGRMTALLAEP